MVRFAAFLLSLAPAAVLSELIRSCPACNTPPCVQFVSRNFTDATDYFCATPGQNCDGESAASLNFYRESCAELKSTSKCYSPIDSEKVKNYQAVRFTDPVTNITSFFLDDVTIDDLLSAQEIEIDDTLRVLIRSKSRDGCRYLLQTLVGRGGDPETHAEYGYVAFPYTATANADCLIVRRGVIEQKPPDISIWDKADGIIRGNYYCGPGQVTAWERCLDCVESNGTSIYCADLWSKGGEDLKNKTNLDCSTTACSETGTTAEALDTECVVHLGEEVEDCYHATNDSNIYDLDFANRDVIRYVINPTTLKDLLAYGVPNSNRTFSDAQKAVLSAINARNCLTWAQLFNKADADVDGAYFVPDATAITAPACLITVIVKKNGGATIADLSKEKDILAMGLYCGAKPPDEMSISTTEKPMTPGSDPPQKTDAASLAKALAGGIVASGLGSLNLLF